MTNCDKKQRAIKIIEKEGARSNYIELHKIQKNIHKDIKIQTSKKRLHDGIPNVTRDSRTN